MSRSPLVAAGSPGRHRVAGLAAGAAALVATGLLSGCGAGQISQTANKPPAVEGSNVTVGTLRVRNLLIPFPSAGTYPRGSNAPLSLVIVNQGTSEDRLVSVQSDVAGTAGLVSPADNTTPPALGCLVNSASSGSTATTASASASASAGTASASASAGLTPSRLASGSPSASGAVADNMAPSGSALTPSGSASASLAGGPAATNSASPSQTPGPRSTEVGLALPVDSLLDLGASCQHVELFGLDRDLTSGDSATVRLSFAKAGAVDLKVTVAGPAEPLTRSPLPDLGEH